MEKIKLYCIKKNRDAKGSVVEWVMSDELGDTGRFDRKGVVALLKDKKYDVVNLQLDKLKRVVDKAVPNEKAAVGSIAKKKSNDITAIFDRAYGFIKKNGMVMLIKRPNGSIKYTEPFDKVQGKIGFEELQEKFESYLADKYGVELTKLVVEHPADKSVFIQYGLEYVEYTILNTKDFKTLDSFGNFNIRCSAGDNNHKGHKCVSTVVDKKTGRTVEDALLGVMFYDTACKEAVDWMGQRVNEIEKRSAGMTKVVKGSK